MGSAPGYKRYHGPTIIDVLRAHIGVEHPGGCLDCATPYQSISEDAWGVFHLTTHHDDSCPVLAEWRRTWGES
jgi:hypothetical protein